VKDYSLRNEKSRYIRALATSLHEHITELFDNGYDQGYEDGKKAIQALSQEPCDDAISRKAVEEITWEEPSYTDALNVLTEVRDKVRALPSVTQKSDNKYRKEAKRWKNKWLKSQKSGKWIIDGYERKCSKCGVSFCETDDVGDYIPDKFCPNCGAKMESEDK
jgi:rubrerythrin